MVIGLDLSVLQTPHKMRGIGAVAKEFVNNIPDDYKKKNTFVLFLYENDQNDALELLKLGNLEYKIESIAKPVPINIQLPWKLKKINGIINSRIEIFRARYGENKLNKNLNIDAYIQFDQQTPFPKLKKSVKKIVVLYDIIPYVLKDLYLIDYKTARDKGLGVISSLRLSQLRKLYRKKITVIANNADIRIAISNHTKNDFINFFGIKKDIEVCYLGVEVSKDTGNVSYPDFEYFIENSWGDFKHPIDLRTKPFIVFIGGVDPRRKIKDLVAAYNIIKAQGNDIRLVFAGDILKSPRVFPEVETQKYITNSSYLEDIVFLGYVSNRQRDWLYKNTIAFVYPSIYEGFGLPVLEAMSFGTPVITYKNTSIVEVAGNAALYVKNYEDIANLVEKLLSNKKLIQDTKLNSTNRSKQFAWDKTVSQILKIATD